MYLKKYTPVVAGARLTKIGYLFFINNRVVGLLVNNIGLENSYDNIL
jgi:hypothetical protein